MTLMLIADVAVPAVADVAGRGELSVMSPLVQYGFAGMCLILLAIVVWMIKHLLAVIERNNSVVLNNTNAITQLQESQGHTHTLLREIHTMTLKHTAVED